MKFSLTKNDKSTYWDEIGLIIITLVSLIIASLLIIFRPSFWIISEGFSVGIGVIALMLVFMYTPCIIYRLFHNDEIKKKT